MRKKYHFPSGSTPSGARSARKDHPMVPPVKGETSTSKKRRGNRGWSLARSYHPQFFGHGFFREISGYFNGMRNILCLWGDSIRTSIL